MHPPVQSNMISPSTLRAFGLALDALWMERHGFISTAEGLHSKAVRMSGIPAAQFDLAFEAARAVEE